MKNRPLTKNDLIKLGKTILKCSSDDTKIQIIDLNQYNPSIDAVYICVKERGGNAIIINSNKEYLTATSSVNFEKHLQEFINGRRTNK